MHRQVPNALTAARVAGAVVLLFTGGLNIWFLAVFAFCSATDVLDGFLARKYGLCSERGKVFDSVADFAVVLSMLAVLIPTQPWNPWMIELIVLIAAIRGISLCIGAIRFGKPAFLHTYLNKTAGFLLCLSPFLMLFCDLGAVVAIACTASMAGAVEDLAINIRSDSLDRNIHTYRDVRIRNTVKYTGTDRRP